MRLVLGNEFTWDGIYGVLNEAGEDRFTVVAELEDELGHISIYDTADYLAREKATAEIDEVYYGKPLAEITQKRHFARAKYQLYIRGGIIGEMTRQYKKDPDEYDIELNSRIICGDVYNWDFMFVDKKRIIARSGVSGGSFALEYADPEMSLLCTLMLVALAGLLHDMKLSDVNLAEGKSISQREPIAVPKFLKGGAEGSGLEEAIGILRDGAEKLGRFNKKAAETSGRIAETSKTAAEAGRATLVKAKKITEKIYGLDKYEDK